MGWSGGVREICRVGVGPAEGGGVTATGTTADNATTEPIPTTAPFLDGTDRDPGADRWVWQSRYVRSLLAIDLGATLVATLTAFVVRFRGAPYANWYLVFSALIPLVWVGLLALTHAYER